MFNAAFSFENQRREIMQMQEFYVHFFEWIEVGLQKKTRVINKQINTLALSPGRSSIFLMEECSPHAISGK